MLAFTLSFRPFQVQSAATQPTRIALEAGRVYELRCDAEALVCAGSGRPLATDLRTNPLVPLVFRADVDTMQVAAATSADVMLWLREVVE